MSFGKRTRPENMGRSISPQQKPNTDEEEEFEFRLPFEITRVHRILFNISVAILVIAFGAILKNDISMRGSGEINMHSIVGGKMRGGFPVIFSSPDGVPGLSRIDTTINSQCLSSRMKVKQNNALGNIRANRQVVLHVPYRAVSDYLLCTMVEEKQRFCQSFYRQRLIARIKSTINARKIIKVSDTRFMSSPIARGQMSMSKMVRGNDERQQIEASDTVSGPLIDRHLGEGLRRLMEDGYISTWDFGWFLSPPKELARFIAEPKGESPCP